MPGIQPFGSHKNRSLHKETECTLATRQQCSRRHHIKNHFFASAKHERRDRHREKETQGERGGGKRKRERERERDTDRQKDRQTDRQKEIERDGGCKGASMALFESPVLPASMLLGARSELHTSHVSPDPIKPGAQCTIFMVFCESCS